MPFALLVLLSGQLSGQPSVIEPPRIGAIEVFGARKTGADRVAREAKIAVGDPIPASQQDLVERIINIKGVAQASAEAYCCVDRKVILYLGVEERDAERFDIREPGPEGAPILSADILAAYSSLLESLNGAVRAGQTAEDLSRGHALIQHEPSRAWQLRLQQLAEPNLDTLRQTLRSGTDDERAVAAVVIGYVERKTMVVDDLQAALRDPDPTVRANALRSLTAFAVSGFSDPQLGMKVEPTWMVEMLDSVFWQDRQNAIRALLTLTEKRPESWLARLKERSTPTLAEMARWKHLPHALPAFLLLGRAHGLSDDEIEKTWVSPERDTFIAKLLKPAKGKQ